MTKKDMYDALVHSYGYKRDGWYPSTRYDEKYRESRETYSAAEMLKKYYTRKDTENMNFNDTKFLVDGQVYNVHDIELTENYGEFPKLTASAYLSPSNRATSKINYGGHRATPSKPITIENVIFNPPATIVFWSDHTKTIVKADYEYEPYDPEKGLAMAIAKKLMGDNKGKYYDMFKYWRNKWDNQNTITKDFKIDISKSPIEKLANSITNAFTKPATSWLDDLEP